MFQKRDTENTRPTVVKTKDNSFIALYASGGRPLAKIDLYICLQNTVQYTSVTLNYII